MVPKIVSFLSYSLRSTACMNTSGRCPFQRPQSGVCMAQTLPRGAHVGWISNFVGRRSVELCLVLPLAFKAAGGLKLWPLSGSFGMAWTWFRTCCHDCQPPPLAQPCRCVSQQMLFQFTFCTVCSRDMMGHVHVTFQCFPGPVLSWWRSVLQQTCCDRVLWQVCLQEYSEDCWGRMLYTNSID